MKVVLRLLLLLLGVSQVQSFWTHTGHREHDDLKSLLAREQVPASHHKRDRDQPNDPNPAAVASTTDTLDSSTAGSDVQESAFPEVEGVKDYSTSPLAAAVPFAMFSGAVPGAPSWVFAMGRRRSLLDIQGSIQGLLVNATSSTNCTEADTEHSKKTEKRYRNRATQVFGGVIVFIYIMAIITVFFVAKKDNVVKPQLGTTWTIIDLFTEFTDTDGDPLGYFEYLGENHELLSIVVGDMEKLARNLRVYLCLLTLCLFFALAVIYGSITQLSRFCKNISEYTAGDLKEAALKPRNWFSYPLSSFAIVFCTKVAFTSGIRLWARGAMRSPIWWQRIFAWTCSLLYIALIVGALTFQALVKSSSYLLRWQAYFFIFAVTQLFAWIIGDNLINSLFWCFAKGEYDYITEKKRKKEEAAAEEAAKKAEEEERARGIPPPPPDVPPLSQLPVGGAPPPPSQFPGATVPVQPPLGFPLEASNWPGGGPYPDGIPVYVETQRGLGGGQWPVDEYPGHSPGYHGYSSYEEREDEGRLRRRPHGGFERLTSPEDSPPRSQPFHYPLDPWPQSRPGGEIRQPEVPRGDGAGTSAAAQGRLRSPTFRIEVFRDRR